MSIRRTSSLLALCRLDAIPQMSKASSMWQLHASLVHLDSSSRLSRSQCWQPVCQTSAGTVRQLTTFPSLAASIKVPSMGESIEEGTISAILKQEGDSVKMDEAIFQIETDKVTVDVRAPEAGTLDKIMVKEEETVKVGQELADVGPESGSSKSSESASQSKEKGDAPTAKAPVEDDKQQLEEQPISEEPMGGEPSPKDTHSASSSQPTTSKPAETSSEQKSQKSKSEGAPPQPGTAAYQPSIRFPPRLTPDGKRISELPAAEQKKYKEQHAASEKQDQPEQQPAQPQAPAKAAQQQSASEPNKFVPYAGQDRGTKLSQAHVLSAKEIEIIELGGADP